MGREPPEQYRARMVIAEEVRRGRMPPAKYLKCVDCGLSREIDPKAIIEYHHEDYGNQLDVIPLCRKCHSIRHKKGKSLDPSRISAQSESMKKTWARKKAEGYTLSDEHRQNLSDAAYHYHDSKKKRI